VQIMLLVQVSRKSGEERANFSVGVNETTFMHIL
jgi:hypothetical protein